MIIENKVEYNDFIQSNIGLVHSCCKRFKDKGIEYEELYSAGCMGLVMAVKRFDEKRGISFSTYAVPVILGEIRLLFRNYGTVKVGRKLKDLYIKISKAKSELNINLKREPTVSEIADFLKVSVEEISESICAIQPIISLSDVNNENKTFIESTDDLQDKICISASIKQAFEILPSIERSLIYYRYFMEYSQQKTAELLGLSQVQISRKEKKILNSLKNILI